ncbi:MAG: hypothetical protein Tp170SUR191951_27 [Prokaryotic dsDNA virus sp.]|nr:MAG: hypothetical protein Tp170SUR191951_27 [Prokaryotic dsDNA virus sp.]|tara:strand:- start:1527 stop:1829 length:303 start_codon:yes stop_codon:yes gene_type:complete
MIAVDQCHYEYDEAGNRIMIPGCMGGAVYGDNGCTCRPVEGSNRDLRARIEDLEDRCAILARQGSDTANRCTALNRRLVDAERAMAAMEARLAKSKPEGV